MIFSPILKDRFLKEQGVEDRRVLVALGINPPFHLSFIFHVFETIVWVVTKCGSGIGTARYQSRSVPVRYRSGKSRSVTGPESLGPLPVRQVSVRYRSASLGMDR